MEFLLNVFVCIKMGLIICGILCNVKILYRLLKNYWEFQDDSSREVTKRGPSECLAL